MTKNSNDTTIRILALVLTAMLFIRGILILFTNDQSTDLNMLLGTGGLETADTQFGLLGQIMRILQLIEGRLWIIVAFPLFFRLSWGREVAVLVAILGIVVQIFRLLAGSSPLAIVWIIIYVLIAVLFSTSPALKSYFSLVEDTSKKA